MRTPRADAADAAPLKASWRRPPAAVAVIGALFLALGCLDLYRGFAPAERGGMGHLRADDLLVATIGVAALVGGVFALYGRNWARWLLTAWMALHVALSLRQPIPLLVHTVIFGAIVFLLFRPGSTAFFRGSAQEATGQRRNA